MPLSESRALHAVVQVIAGLGLNIFPAIFIAVYARIAPIEVQGFLAVALTVGVYVAQLINAFIIEGRLATPGADQDFCLPVWIALLSLGAGALLIFGPTVSSPVVLMLSATGLMTGMLVGRSIGMVSGRWRREAVASTILIISGVIALVLAVQHSGHSVRVLAVGAVAAILMRYLPRTQFGRSGMPPDIGKASWVTAETAVVGAVMPAMTSVVLYAMGPASSVAFRVISTVSGALEPIISYGRYRLLARANKREAAIVGVIFLLGLVAVLVAAFGGFGQLVFGPAWSNVGVVALLLACVWKGLMLLSTVPFAALRAAGETTAVFWGRVVSTLVYLALGLGFLFIWHSTIAIFLSFVIAEIFTGILYRTVARRYVPDFEGVVDVAARRLRNGRRSTDGGSGAA
ncbi:hypothetical protein H5U98_29030 [Mycolicibacterium boenickei]|uniref:Polysaccharide biosynthesis protein n=1 Tax=Mycolicibacterium boenickei TaxID=146017 RepID=A0AAX2ZWC8_9MYCO|nr:hypothetical protein [Mycolicibacterium boenickei]UNB99461.1 hypothetical protein H5U98_29030 [Mycolicibacterium boenickei]